MDARVRDLLLGAFVVGLAVSITLSQAALALLAVRFAWRLAAGSGRVGRPRWPLAWPFLAWIVVSLGAAALSARPWASLAGTRQLLLIAAFYVALDALDDARAAGRCLTALLLLMGAVSVVGVVQVAFCPELVPLGQLLGRVATKCHRAHGFYSIYMTLAGVLSLVLLTTLPALAAVPGAWRGAAWLGGAVGLALTYVRGAWLGVLVGVGVAAGFLRRGRLVLLAGVVVLVAALLLLPGVGRRAASVADPTDSTSGERLSMWRSGLAMALDHPLAGIGPGQVSRVYPAYAPAGAKPRGHLHNTPLQILVERGVPGLLAWGWIFAAWFWRAVGIARGLPPGTAAQALSVGSVAAIAGFLVGGLTEYNFGDSEVVLVAYVVMALPFVASREA